MQATLTATTTEAVPSLVERQALKRAAMEAHARAYLSMPIPQRNGDLLHLCWVARIGRAFDILAAEPDAAKQALYRQAIERMEAEAMADYTKAAEALAAYQQACMAANVPAGEIGELCECEGCRATFAKLTENWERRLAEAN